MLNTRGGIECDLTVARLADDHFYIVTGTGFRTHDFAWIADHIEPGLDATLDDVTEDFGTLSLMGPRRARRPRGGDHRRRRRTLRSRSAMSAMIAIAGHAVRALRVTYVGELGWELHIPIDATGDVFDALMEAGGAARHARRSATARSNPCGSRRAIAPGAPTSRPTTRRSRRGSAGR